MFHIQEVLRENYICLAFDFSCNLFYIYIRLLEGFTQLKGNLEFCIK